MKRIILKGVNPNHFPEITPVSDSQYYVVLGPDVQEIMTIPNDARYVIFNANKEFYTNYGSDVQIPTDIPGQYSTTTEFSPGQRFIADKIDIRLKSKYLTHVHLSFYS